MRGRKSKAKDDDSDSFIASDTDDDSDAGNESYEPEDEITTPQRRTRGSTRQCSAKAKQRIRQDIQEESKTEKEALGEAVQDVDIEYLHDTPSEDDDDGDDGSDKFIIKKPRKRKRKIIYSSEEDGDEEEIEEPQKKRSVRRSLGRDFDEVACGNGIECPSTVDEQTNLPLPRNHVCCVTADGSRFCYALDTLYRVAIDKHQLDASGSLQFLQPPDFCSPIDDDDDLIDQIASRFGREALNIEQSLAYRDVKRRERSPHSLAEAGDLYCCPLCYSEADRRQGNLVGSRAEDDESSEGSEGDSEEKRASAYLFQDDPMTILGNIGLTTAATFCFRLLTDVQKHMEDMHGVDPSDMEGRDVFHRFQVCGSSSR